VKLMILLTLLFKTAVCDDVLEVMVLTGQSNSLGIIKDDESNEVEKKFIDKNIYFYWENRNSKSKIVSTSNDKISHLQIQKFNDGSDQANYGLEMSCFRELYTKGMTNLMLIKVSRGGGKNYFWLKGSKDSHMYDAVVRSVHQACRTLDKESISYRLTGLLYLQGESDGPSCKYAGERAKKLMDNLRVDLPNSSKLKMFIGGIAGKGKYREMTRKEHEDIANKNLDIFYINTSDLLIDGIYKDKLHFNNDSKNEIGKRFAKVILNATDR